MKWEYFSKRRGITLEKFLDGATSIEEATALFESKSVELPEGDQLVNLFNSRLADVADASEVVLFDVDKMTLTKNNAKKHNKK